jgi:hypothetical protein
LRYVYAATGNVLVTIDGFTVGATKPTVPAGTGDEVARRCRMPILHGYRTPNSSATGNFAFQTSRSHRHR